MVSCTSWLGRLISQGPIKNYVVLDIERLGGPAYILDEAEYLTWVIIGHNTLQGDEETLRCITSAI